MSNGYRYAFYPDVLGDLELALSHTPSSHRQGERYGNQPSSSRPPPRARAGRTASGSPTSVHINHTRIPIQYQRADSPRPGHGRSYSNDEPNDRESSLVQLYHPASATPSPDLNANIISVLPPRQPVPRALRDSSRHRRRHRPTADPDSDDELPRLVPLTRSAVPHPRRDVFPHPHIRYTSQPPRASDDLRRHLAMSRAGSSARPNHIPLPTNQFRHSPNGSPGGSPAPLASPTSPRSSFLSSFISRSRSRANTITARGSPRAEQQDPMARAGAQQAQSSSSRRDGGGVTRSVSTPISGGLAESAPPARPTGPPIDPKGRTHRIRLVPNLENTRSLAFEPVVRELFPISVQPGMAPPAAAASVSTLGPLVNGKPPALLLKLGRYTERTSHVPVGDINAAAGAASGSGAANGTTGGTNGNAVGTGGEGSTADRPSTGIGGHTMTFAGGGGEVTAGRVAFKSKVVSRSHAEIWCDSSGKFFIRDTKSSSGTFLNNIRLSAPCAESSPTQINDGDVLQLGVDYQGGQEELFRCIKMRVEVGREWQRGANEFNTNALRQLKALGGSVDVKGKGVDGTPSRKAKTSVTDCCICLFSVTVCQSLFIAPCSHVFHYKCIRPLLQQHHPGFSCPLCRTFANLEEDVETEDAWELASRRASVISRRPSNHSIRLPRDTAEPSEQVEPGSIAPDGEPSSSVAFGQSTASISQLLAGSESTSASEEGGTEEAPSRTEERTDNAEGGNGQRGENEVDDLTNQFARGIPITSSTASRTGSSSRSASQNHSRRSSVNDPLATAALPMDMHTPRNEYFLSTLAPSASDPHSGSVGNGGSASIDGMPGMIQQFERAEAVQTIQEEVGTGEASLGGNADEDHTPVHLLDEDVRVGDEEAEGSGGRRKEGTLVG